MSCLYSTGCNETAQTYYLTDFNVRQSVDRIEATAKDKFGEAALIYSGAALGAITGNNFNARLTTHVQLQGNLRWHTAGLSYSYKF